MDRKTSELNLLSSTLIDNVQRVEKLGQVVLNLINKIFAELAALAVLTF